MIESRHRRRRLNGVSYTLAHLHVNAWGPTMTPSSGPRVPTTVTHRPVSSPSLNVAPTGNRSPSLGFFFVASSPPSVGTGKSEERGGGGGGGPRFQSPLLSLSPCLRLNSWPLWEPRCCAPMTASSARPSLYGTPSPYAGGGTPPLKDRQSPAIPRQAEATWSWDRSRSSGEASRWRPRRRRRASR